MKVLARRDNSSIVAFIIIAVVFIAFIIIFADWLISTDFFTSIRDESNIASSSDLIYDFIVYLAILVLLTGLICKVGRVFIKAIQLPSVVIEYDEYGIYIYSRTRETRVIRFEDIKSQVSEEEDVNIYASRGFFRVKITTIKMFTGTLRIELKDGYERVDCIAYVTEVEEKLRKLVRKVHQEDIAELEESVERLRRARELEELAKHDPNT